MKNVPENDSYRIKKYILQLDKIENKKDKEPKNQKRIIEAKSNNYQIKYIKNEKNINENNKKYEKNNNNENRKVIQRNIEINNKLKTSKSSYDIYKR